MNDELGLVIDSLPFRLKSEMQAYHRWLKENVSGLLEEVKEEYRYRINPKLFISLAVYKKILDLPRNQLNTIRKTLSYTSSYGIYSLRVGNDLIREDSEVTRSLSILCSRLEGALKEEGYGYIISAKSLNDLAYKIARNSNDAE